VGFGSCCNYDTLNADELQIIFGSAVLFKTQLSHLADSAVEFIERPRLRVAPRKRRDRGNIIAFFVLLDNDVKIALHGDPPS